jgi:hypothetical protein
MTLTANWERRRVFSVGGSFEGLSYRFEALPRMGELNSLQSKEHRDTYKVMQIEHTCSDQAIPASVLLAIEPVTGGIL